MFSKPRYLVFLLALSFTTGCGLFGTREAFKKIAQFSPGSIGCLNKMGEQFRRFAKGDIESGEWEGTWDCATDSLGVYKRFVQGSDPQGYTPEDMHAFLSRYLYAGTPISLELVQASFKLKQSLFGGTDNVLTMDELDQFIKMLKIGRDTTVRLLPYFQKQQYFKSVEEYKKFDQAFVQMGIDIGKGLNTANNPSLTFETAKTIARELSAIFHWEIPDDFEKSIAAVKNLMMAGDQTQLEASRWPEVFELITSYVAPLVAWKGMTWSDFPNTSAGGDFLVEIWETIKTSIGKTINHHGGGIPFTALDSVIDQIPISFFADVQKDTLKTTIRPLFNRLLRTSRPGTIDTAVFDKVDTTVRKWQRGQRHIQNIFDRYQTNPEGFHLKEFIDATFAYRETFAGSGDHEAALDIHRILLLGRDHRPHKINDDGEIEFIPFFRRTLNSVSRFHALELLIRMVFEGYSDTPNRDRATIDEFKQFTDDYKQLAFELKVAEVTPNGYLKRFNEMNLFVYSSNGDNYLDVSEGMEYASFLLSMKNFGKRIFLNGIAKACPSLGKDPMGWDWVSIECFQREFIMNRHEYWKHQPGLLAFYDGLSPAQQADFETVMQKGARRFGATQEPVGSFDIDGYSGLMHYLEALVQRFDYDQNQILNLDEILNAFPIFKNTLARFAQMDPVEDHDTLEAVFTYTVYYGEAPKKDILNLVKFLWWSWTRPFWSINASRYDLYTVISVFTSKQ
jgi:hypothetical protein